MAKDKRPVRSYDIIILGVLTLLATVTWIGFEVFRNVSTKPSVTPATEYHTRPLTTSLDIKTLDGLQKRLVISPTEVSIAPVSSQSGSLQTATSSGAL